LKLTRLLQASSLAIAWLASPGVSAQELREAPNAAAEPVNQLSIAGNACGPAALLSAYRFGNADWRKVADSVKGETDKQRLSTIIREVAMRPSKHLNRRARWSRAGVNIADLCDIANELAAGRMLPKLQYEVLFLKPRETQEQLLKRVHERLEKSLDRGLPPLLSIRRVARRKGNWTNIDGHFVTVIGVPKKLDKGARSFAVTYLDPWGGKRREGRIAISDQTFLTPGQPADPSLSPCLEALFPTALVGRSKVQPGEPTVLTVSAGMGRW
jgi:hypothetical protein